MLSKVIQIRWGSQNIQRANPIRGEERLNSQRFGQLVCGMGTTTILSKTLWVKTPNRHILPFTSNRHEPLILHRLLQLGLCLFEVQCLITSHLKVQSVTEHTKNTTSRIWAVSCIFEVEKLLTSINPVVNTKYWWRIHRWLAVCILWKH